MALATEGDCSSIETAGMDGFTGCGKTHVLYQGTTLQAAEKLALVRDGL
jgi:hypothetical protein